MRYLPVDPIAVAFTGTSSDFIPVNTSSGPKEYVFISLQVCHIKRGLSGIAAATSDDFRLASGSYLLLWLMPGEGVRVISGGVNGTLQIGDTSK